MRTNRRPAGPLAASGMVSSWGASSMIESVQRGTLAVGSAGATNTATITSVDTTRSIVVWGNVSAANVLTNGVFSSNARIALTNATTLTATQDTSGSGLDQTIAYQVIQFRQGVVRSVQRGTVNVSSTATITEVDTSKAFVSYLGFSTNNGSPFNGTDPGTYKGRIVLTNSTTVTETIGIGGASVTTSFEVVEFF